MGFPIDAGMPKPVGVTRLPSPQVYSDVPLYEGVSFCDAVRRAGEGEILRILPGSVGVCRWSPVVLGFQPPRDRFERSLAPRLPFPVAGLLLGPLHDLPDPPEVVILRAPWSVLQPMVAMAGPEGLWDGHRGRADRSAIPFLWNGERAGRRTWIDGVNRLLASLARRSRWQAFTRWLFRSGLVTAGFDALISRTLADMSVCRNSTVIPLLTGRVNLSFFCAGGITWGRNRPDHLTSGWPWAIYQKLTNDQCTNDQSTRYQCTNDQSTKYQCTNP